MGRDPDHPYRDLIDHPVQAIDRFLLDYELDDAWVGILGGPRYDDGEIVVTYNVRTVDGPYRSQMAADFDYRFGKDTDVDVLELYQEQVAVIKTAFPEATVQCHNPMTE